MGIKVEITSENRHGREVYVLLEDYHITVRGRVFVIPAGYKTDFMSIPWFFRAFIGVVDKRAAAALLHDYLLDSNVVPANQADGYFRVCLKELGMGGVERNFYYGAVRLNSKYKATKERIVSLIARWFQ